MRLQSSITYRLPLRPRTGPSSTQNPKVSMVMRCGRVQRRPRLNLRTSSSALQTFERARPTRPKARTISEHNRPRRRDCQGGKNLRKRYLQTRHGPGRSPGCLGCLTQSTTRHEALFRAKRLLCPRVLPVPCLRELTLQDLQRRPPNRHPNMLSPLSLLHVPIMPRPQAFQRNGPSYPSQTATQYPLRIYLGL
jgi:hypothetical protein